MDSVNPYTSTMSTIVEKIYDMFIILDALNDHEKNIIENQIAPYLDDIDKNINLIKDKLISVDSYKTDTDTNNKINDAINIDRRRQKIIERAIFPYYWTLNERINQLPNEKISEMEKILDRYDLKM